MAFSIFENTFFDTRVRWTKIYASWRREVVEASTTGKSKPLFKDANGLDKLQKADLEQIWDIGQRWFYNHKDRYDKRVERDRIDWSTGAEYNHLPTSGEKIWRAFLIILAALGFAFYYYITHRG